MSTFDSDYNLNSTKFTLSASTAVRGKAPPFEDEHEERSFWWGVNHSFKNVEWGVDELVSHLQAGYPISAALTNGHRKGVNFQSGQLLGLDFDTEDERSSLDVLESEPFIQDNALLLYTTASHTPEKPRARVLFALDEPITSQDEYKKLVLALMDKYSLVDESAKDAVRLWYGAPGCEVRILGNVVSKDELPQPAPEEKKSTPIRKGKDSLKAHKADFNRDLHIAMQCLSQLSQARVDDRDGWLHVGMALHSISDEPEESNVLCGLWINWSQRSKKYKEGECAQKWQGFSTERDVKHTLGSLRYWAADDGGKKIVLPGSRGAKPSQIRKALTDLGYSFKMNEMDSLVYVNGVPINDELLARILVDLNENEYRNNRLAELTCTAAAAEDRFHPIKEFFEQQEWDRRDHIAHLASYFKDKHGVFGQYLRKWLIGAVARIYTKGEFNPALVIVAKQDTGKSYLSRWLAGDLLIYHTEDAIRPDDKDDVLRLLSIWIWEVGELGATTRRSDIEALKAYMTRQHIRERRAFGHFDVQGWAITSFICTVNDDGSGFLNDPTGSRRFNVCEVTSINWDYATKVDRHQLWAQAKALYDAGEKWQLHGDDLAAAAAINREYEIEPAAFIYLDEFITRDPESQGIASLDIVSELKAMGAAESDEKLTRSISQYMKKRYDVKAKLIRFGRSSPTRGYEGFRVIPLRDRRDR